jgi:hypothetical protein
VPCGPTRQNAECLAFKGELLRDQLNAIRKAMESRELGQRGA